MSAGEHDSGDVLVRVEGRAGYLTLNRPKALNALTHTMVLRLDGALAAWERDPAVETVVIEGAGERGLCAGGDIRAIHEDARTGGTASADFWRDEYRLNARIARYPKPYVALMDGIVMGGGVGVSAHGTVRVVTERSGVAMPETGIGFVPDVGGTYLLGLAPGELGVHLALTGAVVGAADALLCGLANHFVPSERLPEPADDLLLAKSPTALKVTLASVRRARRLGPLERVLEQEYRVSCAALSSPDLVEGIRTQVIDKDRTPRWSPATLAGVGAADADRFFVPLGARELRLAGPGSLQEVPW
ncbi:enoyl-CoA hydratase/isomerase family protein [Streptomyces cinereoruber]|uniref:enoyl-CoA hydratase/isomerase family protein n=1 Tax=Streptomyces cinereoruber TaxID=67260 RepID=UPI003EB824ED